MKLRCRGSEFPQKMSPELRICWWGEQFCAKLYVRHTRTTNFLAAKKALQAKIEEPTKCLVSTESLVARLLGKTHDWPTFRVI